MTHISQKVVLDEPADVVWKLVGDFTALDKWHKFVKPYPTEGRGPGAVRTLTIGGAIIPETLASVDRQARAFTYTIANGAPTPYENFRSTLKVNDLGSGRCEFIWTIDCDPTTLSEEKVVEMLGGFIAVGLKGVQRHFVD